MIGWLRWLEPGDEPRPRPRRRAADCGPGNWTRREMLTLRRRKPKPDGTWRVRIDADRCSDCQACTKICDQAALMRCRREPDVVYLLDAGRCNGCTACRDVCAEKALTVTRADRARKTVEAGRLTIGPCPKCGDLAAGMVTGICVACRQDERRLGGQGARLR